MENAFLRFVYELKPADLSGKGRTQEEKALAVLDGRKADLEGRIARTKARLDRAGGDVDSLLDLLVKWDGELKAVVKERDASAALLATDTSRVLRDAQTLVDALREASGDDRADLRRRLKARIRELVESLWVYTWSIDGVVRAAEIQVVLRGGGIRTLLIAWCRAGGYPGLSVGFGRLVGIPGNDAHLADKRLSEYRTKPEVRDFFTRHEETMKPAILKVVQAEIATRGHCWRRIGISVATASGTTWRLLP